ncbi:methyltransferase domain-containing protein [Candidatus Woesearchaeota archaeon]|nr:methyltransferase domain-containing protein [Candidatus Woesearchaeota archaeon]
MGKKETPWDLIAKEYSDLVEDVGDVYHKTYLNPVVLKLLGNIKNKKILDLACGNGYFSITLAKKKAIVTGVDYSKELIKIAESKKQKLNVKFLVRDSSNLKSIKKHSFDFIVSNMAFHDIKNIDKTIKECARVIKKNGKLIFSIPHPAFFLSKRRKIGTEYFRPVKRYMSRFSVNHPTFKYVKFYHRPVEYYLKLLFKCGFVVSGFHEITSRLRKGKQVKDEDLLHHKKEIPIFLLIEATYST